MDFPSDVGGWGPLLVFSVRRTAVALAAVAMWWRCPCFEAFNKLRITKYGFKYARRWSLVLKGLI
jgi:hypothetical protein